MTQLDFDLNTIEDAPKSSYEPIPAGTYTLQITDESVKSTASGGEMLNVTMRVADGQPYAGRLIFSRYTIKNANPKAEVIGRAQLKALCLAALGRTSNNMADLLGRSVVAEVIIDKPYTTAKGTFHNNAIRKVSPIAGGSVAAPQPKQVAMYNDDDINF